LQRKTHYMDTRAWPYVVPRLLRCEYLDKAA